MRIRAALLALAVLILLAAGVLPGMLLMSIPQSGACRLQGQRYQESFSASGLIESANTREIYLDTPVIAEHIPVAVGERIQKDEVLAFIDTSSTKAVLAGSIGVTASSSSGSGQGAGVLGELEALARLYGFSQEDLQQVLGSSATRISDVRESVSETVIPSAILAPMSGIIGEINMKSGVLTQSGRPIVTIIDDSDYIVTVDVNEKNIAGVKIGDSAIVTGSALQKSYHGAVTKIHPIAKSSGIGSAKTVTVAVEIRLLDADSDIRPGYSASAQILSGEERTIFTVPYEAVRQDKNNREYVYVYRDSGAKKRYITTGLELYDGTQVLAGLSENELVLLSPDAVSEGSLVRITQIAKIAEE